MPKIDLSRDEDLLKSTTKTRSIKMRAITKTCVILVSTCFLIGGFFLTPSFAEKPIKAKLAHCFPNQTLAGRVWQKWADLVEAKTNGKLKILVFGASSLYGQNESYQAMQHGGIEFVWLTSMGNTTLNKVFLATMLPTMWPDYESQKKFWESSAMEPVYKKFEKTMNMKVLPAYGIAGTGRFWSAKKKVETIADFKGIKVGTLDPVNRAGMAALGASPVTVTMEDAVTASQTGMTDAGLATCPSARFMFMEFNKFALMNPWYVNLTNVGVNVKFWNKLPAEIREQVLEASRELWPIAKEMDRQMDDEAIEYGKKKYGIEFYKFNDSDWQEVRRIQKTKVWSKFAKPIGKDAYQVSLELSGL
ncbi:MAG: TRAP transporter substrate-binding protein [Desulfatiglans sp.]|nr:TRAP transporter substrate-binding protein [Desulfatiglans sp.]